MCNNQSCPSYTTDILRLHFFSTRTDGLPSSISSVYRYIDVVFIYYRIRSNRKCHGIPERKCVSDSIRPFFLFFLFGQSDGPSSMCVFCFFSFFFFLFFCYFLFSVVSDDSVSSVKIDDHLQQKQTTTKVMERT